MKFSEASLTWTYIQWLTALVTVGSHHHGRQVGHPTYVLAFSQSVDDYFQYFIHVTVIQRTHDSLLWGLIYTQTVLL